jgi:neutral ceramidase
MAHRYSELPAEDKQEAELPAILPKHRTAWSRISLVVLTPFLVLTSLLALVGIANVISGRPALAQLNEIGWFSRLPRASDGQFLLGVGKADITGYDMMLFLDGDEL